MTTHRHEMNGVGTRHGGLTSWTRAAFVACALGALSLASSGWTADAETKPPEAVKSAEEAPKVAQSTASKAPTKIDLEAVKIINNRNIFDQSRTPGAIFTVRTNRPAPPPERERFALTGIISYGRGTFAFFDGSRPDYKKVVQENATIAGYTIEEIEHSSVKLVEGTNSVELPVGMQLTKDDDGGWTKSTAVPFNGGSRSRPGSDSRDNRAGRGDRGNDFNSRRSSNQFGSASRYPSSGAASTSTTTTPVSKAEADDILKKLMEAREKELNQ